MNSPSSCLSAPTPETLVTTTTATLSWPSYTEHCLQIDGRTPEGLLQAAASQNEALNTQPLGQFIFGGCQHFAGCKDVLQAAPPTTWLQGDACREGRMYGLQASSLSGREIHPVQLDGEGVGFWYEDELARTCRLTALRPADPTASREEQTRSFFERAARALESCGMHFTDTVRTWLYLDELLKWYDPFNRVRTTFFEEQGVFDRMVPASTGIGARNPLGAALAGALIAVRPKADSPLTITEVGSPLQCSAEDYRSSFSRAVALQVPGGLQALYISGTASIAPDGCSQYRDDPARQIERTLDVVEAILACRGMGWQDSTRAIVYYTDVANFQPLFAASCARRGIPRFPLATVQADVCRDDLLFEIELDAATQRNTVAKAS